MHWLGSSNSVGSCRLNEKVVAPARLAFGSRLGIRTTCTSWYRSSCWRRIFVVPTADIGGPTVASSRQERALALSPSSSLMMAGFVISVC